MRKWMKISTAEFVMRFKDPVLREALREMWIPEFSMFFMLFTLAYLHNRNAGYPIRRFLAHVAGTGQALH